MKFFVVIALVTLCGCAGYRTRPGRTQTLLDGVSASAVQSQDPQAPTTQTVDLLTETSLLAIGQTNVPVITRSHKVVTTTIGAAQKNMAQEIGAKLASVRWLQWFGVVLILFGGASLFYPPLKLIVNSVTSSVFCIAAGAALIFAPLVIVGHEVLIVCVATGAAALWFFAHRHGSISAELKTLKKNL
ncbi:MAG TPA: hypothetical protein VN516_09440 [Candidatus Baltobacteraceae bacterium]|nr:hypothetical protein [Candidatus Baltobacteraceae bacterium]